MAPRASVADYGHELQFGIRERSTERLRELVEQVGHGNTSPAAVRSFFNRIPSSGGGRG